MQQTMYGSPTYAMTRTTPSTHTVLIVTLDSFSSFEVASRKLPRTTKECRKVRGVPVTPRVDPVLDDERTQVWVKLSLRWAVFETTNKVKSHPSSRDRWTAPNSYRRLSKRGDNDGLIPWNHHSQSAGDEAILVLVP